MSVFEKIGQICAGSVVLALGSFAGGIAVANGVVGLADLGFALRNTNAKRICDKAQQQALTDFKSRHEYADVNLERVQDLLNNANSHMDLSSKDLADAVKAATDSTIEKELTTLIIGRIPFAAGDDRIKAMLKHVIHAGITACYKDAQFEKTMTSALLIRVVQDNDLQITLLNTLVDGQDKIIQSLDDLKDDMARLNLNYKDNPEDALGDLRDIAAALDHPKPHRGSWDDLIKYIAKKIPDLRATAAKYEQSGPDDLFANSKSEVARLLRERRHSEADALFDGILDMGRDGDLGIQLQKAAFALEGKADIALNENRVQDAYDFLSRAADSFASVDPAEPANRRHTYMQQLYFHGLRYGGSGIRLAIDMIETAIKSTPKNQFSSVWAMCQNALGITLRNQGTRTDGAAGTDLLARAVAAYDAALSIYTIADHPVNWARTQNNLAGALQQEGTRTDGTAGTDLLARAVAAYGAALSIRTLADHPVQWAATQNNLAVAVEEQGTRTEGTAGTDLLARAVAAYGAALSIYTIADHPVHWALTQNNLANALQEQGTRTDGTAGTDLMARAVAAYDAALSIRTIADHPVQWAITQHNLALAELARADHAASADPQAHLEAALVHVEGALTVFDPDHMAFYHQKATTLRDHIKARLDPGTR